MQRYITNFKVNLRYTSLESDKINFKELGHSKTLLKTATDRDWSALAGEVQDSRALVKQRGLCEGLQLSGGIPHEPREEVQGVVAHQGFRKCDILKRVRKNRGARVKFDAGRHMIKI